MSSPPKQLKGGSAVSEHHLLDELGQPTEDVLQSGVTILSEKVQSLHGAEQQKESHKEKNVEESGDILTEEKSQKLEDETKTFAKLSDTVSSGKEHMKKTFQEASHITEGYLKEATEQMRETAEHLKFTEGDLKNAADTEDSNLSDTALKIGSDVKKMASEGKEHLSSLASDAMDTLKELENKTLKEAGDMAEKTGDTLQGVISEITKVAGDLTGTAVDSVKEKGSEVAKVACDMTGKASESLKEVKSEFTKVAADMVDKAAENVKEAESEIGKLTSDLTETVVDDVKEKESEAAKLASDLAGKASEAECEITKVASDLAGKVVDSVKKTENEAVREATNLAEELSDTVKETECELTESADGLSEKLENVKKGMESGIQEEKSTLESMMTDVYKALGDVEKNIEKVPKMAAEKAKEVEEVVGTIMSKGQDSVHETLEKRSEKRKHAQKSIGDDNEEVFRKLSAGIQHEMPLLSTFGEQMKSTISETAEMVSEAMKEGKDLISEKFSDYMQAHDIKEDVENKEAEERDDSSGATSSNLKELKGNIIENADKGEVMGFQDQQQHEKTETEKDTSEKVTHDEKIQKIHEFVDNALTDIKSGADKISEKFIEAFERGKEFYDEKLSLDSEAAQKTSTVDDHSEGKKEDFLGAADFGGLQQTMKDVFHKGGERADEFTKQFATNTESNDSNVPEGEEDNIEAPLAKKIIQGGEDVPEQVGTVTSTGKYIDDYEPKKDDVLEKINDVKESPIDKHEATDEGDSGEEEGTVGVVIEEHFEKVTISQHCTACENRESAGDSETRAMEHHDVKNGAGEREIGSGKAENKLTDLPERNPDVSLDDDAEKQHIDVQRSIIEETGGTTEVVNAVPPAPIRENLPTAFVESTMEDVVKFAAPPTVHETAPEAVLQTVTHDEKKLAKSDVTSVITSGSAPEKRESSEKTAPKTECTDQQKRTGLEKMTARDTSATPLKDEKGNQEKENLKATASEHSTQKVDSKKDEQSGGIQVTEEAHKTQEAVNDYTEKDTSSKIEEPRRRCTIL